tara:strand:+ start:438 stop:1448 length:1011 start_codon:yes stop_codon:yes gene_type:complete
MAGPATGLLIASLGISAAGMGMSFAQAGAQRKLGEKVDRDAEKAMAAARKKLEVNYLDALAINKLPYELEREALLVQGAQSVEAARESERGAAAGVGRVQLAQQQGQRNITKEMGRDLMSLNVGGAKESSRLRDVGVQLDLGAVAGAQMASADASEAEAAATAQGFQQLAAFGAQALEAAPLFSRSAGVRASDKAYRQANQTGREAYMKGAGKGKGLFGTSINSGYRQASGAEGRQGVLNKSTFTQIEKNNPDFINQFNKAQGKQGIQFNKDSFLANPQGFINRGSVQQQALFNNALTGVQMSPIEDEDQSLVQEQDLLNTDPMALLGYLSNKRKM